MKKLFINFGIMIWTATFLFGTLSFAEKYANNQSNHQYTNHQVVQTSATLS